MAELDHGLKESSYSLFVAYGQSRSRVMRDIEEMKLFI